MLSLQCFHLFWCLATVNTQASFTRPCIRLLQCIIRSRNLFFLTMPATHTDFETSRRIAAFQLQPVLVVFLVLVTFCSIFIQKLGSACMSGLPLFWHLLKPGNVGFLANVSKKSGKRPKSRKGRGICVVSEFGCGSSTKFW